MRGFAFLNSQNTKTAPFGSGFCGERKATLTEYLEKNVEKLALLRFSFGEAPVAA